MSNDLTNPYRSNDAATLDSPQGLRLQEPLPKGVLIFSILFIIFGVLGVMAFPMAGLGAVMQSVAPNAQQSATPEEAFNQKIQEVGKDTMIGNLVLSGIDTLLSAIMVFGAVQVIRRRSIGLRISSAICWIYIIFELVRLVYGVFIARQYSAAMQSVPTEELKQNPAGQFLIYFFENMGTIVMVFAIGAFLFRMAYYFLAYSFFRRPKNVEYMLANS